jgi:hypothetical protein
MNILKIFSRKNPKIDESNKRSKVRKHFVGTDFWKLMTEEELQEEERLDEKLNELDKMISNIPEEEKLIIAKRLYGETA